MKISLNLVFTLYCFFFFLSANAQYLIKTGLTKKEKKSGVVGKYSETNRYDGMVMLTLYANNSYYYKIISTNYEAFSTGRWYKKNGFLILENHLQNDAVPVKLKYSNNADIANKYKKSPFIIPVNLKGERLSDSRIFINNDTNTYCFPFFDTCIGNHDLVKNIKISFGDGFYSKWITVNMELNKKMLIIAQVDFMFSNYISFKKEKYKIIGSKINLKK